MSASNTIRPSNFAVLLLRRIEIIYPSPGVLLGHSDTRIETLIGMSDLRIIYTKDSLMSNVYENS
jgi:hypothetical protein